MKKIIVLILVFSVFTCVSHAARTHVFKSGDTLWELSAKHYGDPTLYPVLLEVNGIDNPRSIPVGKLIIIPDKSDMKKIAEEKDPARKRELMDSARSSSRGTPSDQGHANSVATGADEASRSGAIDPNQTGFNRVLGGPRVSPDQLIKTNVP